MLTGTVSSVLWIIALCLVTEARGYHPLWGLTLLIPPFLLAYPWLFPDRFCDRWVDGQADTFWRGGFFHR